MKKRYIILLMCMFIASLGHGKDKKVCYLCEQEIQRNREWIKASNLALLTNSCEVNVSCKNIVLNYYHITCLRDFANYMMWEYKNEKLRYKIFK